MKTLPLLLVAALSVHCSKTQKTKNLGTDTKIVEAEKIVNYDSPLAFVYDAQLAQKNRAYQVGETYYPLDQLYRSKKSLLRLVEENKKYWLVSAYLQALVEKAKNKSPVTIELPFRAEGLNAEELLGDRDISIDPAIQFSFSETDNLHGNTQIGKQEYSETQLSQNNIDHGRNRQKIFNLAMKEIETRLSRSLVSEAAQKAGQDFNDFVQKNSESTNTVTPQDIQDFATKNSIPEKDLNDKTSQTIRDIIASKRRSQSLLRIAAKLLGDKTVGVSFYRPYLQTKEITYPKGTPQKGEGRVDVTLISNFLCKRCSPSEKKLVELFESLSDKISLSYVFQIRPEERMSRFAAEASLCVHAMDQGKFWELHRETFNEDFDANEENIKAWMESQGLSTEQLMKCFSSRESNKVLMSQLELTQATKTLTLPIVMINGKIFENPSAILPIQNLIEHEFKNQSSKSAQHGHSKKGWLAWIRSFFK